MAKAGVFYIEFDNEDVRMVCAFNISAKGMKSIYPDGDEFEDIISDLDTEFGIHDNTSNPHNKVDGIGFVLYELEEERIPELMDRWFEEFATLAGRDNLSPQWYNLGDLGDVNEYIIFSEVDKAV